MGHICGKLSIILFPDRKSYPYQNKDTRNRRRVESRNTKLRPEPRPGLNNRDRIESQYYVALIHLNALLSRILGRYGDWQTGSFIPQTTMVHSVPSHASVTHDLFQNLCYVYIVHTPDPDGAMTICNETLCAGINWKLKRVTKKQ